MTVDLVDLANALRWVLIGAAVGWIIYAWVRRIEYRRAVLVLVAFIIFDLLAHLFATWAEQPGSNLPTDFPIFTVAILLAAASGLAIAFFYARRIGLAPANMLDAALLALIAGGVGARAYHVALQWDYYSQNTDDITNFAQGGMGLRGGLMLGVIAVLMVALMRCVSISKLLDAGALGLALAQSLGWYGAHLVGVYNGVESDASFAQDLPDAYGILAPRLPLQLIASIFFFVLFLALARMAWRREVRMGSLFATYLFVSAAGMFVLGFFRADETLHWGALRVDQLFDMTFFLIGLGLIVAPRIHLPARGVTRTAMERS